MFIVDFMRTWDRLGSWVSHTHTKEGKKKKNKKKLPRAILE